MTGLRDFDVSVTFERAHPAADGTLGESHVACDGLVLTSERSVLPVGMNQEIRKEPQGRAHSAVVLSFAVNNQSPVKLSPPSLLAGGFTARHSSVRVRLTVWQAA